MVASRLWVLFLGSFFGAPVAGCRLFMLLLQFLLLMLVDAHLKRVHCPNTVPGHIGTHRCPACLWRGTSWALTVQHGLGAG